MLRSKKKLNKCFGQSVLSLGSLTSICDVELHVKMFVCMEKSSYYGKIAF